MVGLESGARLRFYRGGLGEGAQKGRCYPRSYRGTRPRFASDTLMSLTDNTAPFAVCFSLPLSPQPMQKYLRNILEKHC